MIFTKSIQILKSGIALITDKNIKTSTVTFCIYFKVGSAYESEKKAGITNLTMNMFFRRLGNLKQTELYSSMEKLGGEIKGFVSRDYTCFEYTVMSRFASEALELFLKFFDKTVWSQEDLGTEKKIALKKIEFTDDYFDYCLSKQIGIASYTKNIKGTKESVESITLDEINKWKSKYFIPSNACFVIAGNFDVEIKKVCEETLESLENIPAPEKKYFVPSKAFNRNSKDHIIRKAKDDPSELRLFFDVDLKSICLSEFLTAVNLFSLGVYGKLPYQLKDVSVLTDCVDCDIHYTEDYASIDIALFVKSSDVNATLNIISKCINEMKSEITKDFLDSGILFNTLNESKYYDTSETIAELYGYYDFILNKSYSVEDSISARDTITPQSIMELSKNLFRPENLFLCINSKLSRSEIKEYTDMFFESLE